MGRVRKSREVFSGPINSHFDEILNLGQGSCQDDPNDSDSDYEEVRSDLSSNLGILKWKEVNLSFESDDSSVLSGVRRIRSDWNSLFEARLQPKRFKPKENDEILIKTLEEILIKEGKIYIVFNESKSN